MERSGTLLHESCRPLCYENIRKCKSHCRITGVGEAISSETDITCSRKCFEEYRRCLDACS